MMTTNGATPPEPDEQLRILILEDVAADAELMERGLRTSGLDFVCRRVAGKTTFLRELEEFSPHLVLSDLEMPRYSGMEAIADVHERCPSTPVIIVTGAVNDEVAVGCIQAGAEDYVLKDRLVRLSSAIHNALEKKRERERRADAEATLQKLSRAVQQSPSSVMITDAEGRIEYVNPKFTELSGYTAAEVLGRNQHFQKSEHTTDRKHQELWETITSGSVWRGVLCNTREDGDVYWVAQTISPIVDADGTITHFVASGEDLTTSMECEARLDKHTNFDELTGLPSRALALDRLSQAVAAGRRSMSFGAIALVDLDRFQVVNDSLTHQAGDLVLAEAAERLRACVGDGDTLARLSGDTFLLILQDLDGLAGAEGVARGILDAFSGPFVLEEEEFFLTASVGLSAFPGQAEDPDILLREADSAMHRVKEEGGNGFRFFSPQMNVRLRERVKLEGQLRHALERGELSLHYQPLVALGSERVIGAEALMRWDHPELGSVSPVDFIPIAEHNGLIVPIGEWALQTACREAVVWAKGGHPLEVGVNVSAAQFTETDLVATVVRVLEDTGLPPQALNLEITETMVMNDAALAIDILQQLRVLGVSLALDDFGTGYSSLAYLRRLPVDTLKIDRMFVADLIWDPSAAALVAGIIGLARGLGLKVVGEGVETGEQLVHLRSEGCDLAQGLYFSGPLPASEFRARLGQPLNTLPGPAVPFPRGGIRAVRERVL